MADSPRNLDSAFASPQGANDTRPRTPVLLWIIVFAAVVMMVVWGIRRYGTRSSAEPQSLPQTSAWTPLEMQPASAAA